MAIKMTSMAARWGGTVTYQDNSIENFSANIDPQGNLWSQDQAQSFEASRQLSWFGPTLYPYWAAIVAAIESLPEIAHFDFGNHPAVQKPVTDMIARLDVIVAYDDNSNSTIGIVFNGNRNGVVVSQVVVTATNPLLAAQLETVSNSAEFVAELKQMFEQAMDYVECN